MPTLPSEEAEITLFRRGDTRLPRRGDSMQFEIAEVAPDTIRVALAGRLDAGATEAAELRFAAAVGSVGYHALADCTDVGFIGSLGIRLLLSVARSLQRRGRKMVLFGVSGQPHEVFETIALSDLIPIVADEAEARRVLAA